TATRQIAAMLPSAVPAGNGSLVLSYNGRAGRATPIKVIRTGFGINTASGNGVGAGIITWPDYSLLTFTRAAHPGDVLILWGTGLGPVDSREVLMPLPS